MSRRLLASSNFFAETIIDLEKKFTTIPEDSAREFLYTDYLKVVDDAERAMEKMHRDGSGLMIRADKLLDTERKRRRP